MLILICISVFSCKKDAESCVCETYEECIDDKCVLKDDVSSLGGTIIEGGNQYTGVVRGNDCMDTLIFVQHPNNILGGFSFWANVPPTTNLGATVIQQFSDKEYLFSSLQPICSINEVPIITDFRCKIEEDSTLMNIYLFERGSQVYLDTIDLVLYR